tara:strand:+ start:236 stop:1138 length:903 start_codon:yes stop_codon:yes gene_type:complete
MLDGRKILITGAQGMLAQAFRAGLPAGVVALSREDCDVRDRAAVMALRRYAPDIVIHCAANVNADACEDAPEECRQTQVEGTRNVLDMVRDCGASLLYPQSFLIFDGVEQPITETTAANPLSWYGQCKLEAARLIRNEWEDHLIVQMGGFFGGGAIDKNFIGKFVPHVCRLIASGTREVAIGDRIWQPTWTQDLARNCLTLLDHGKTGTFNMASHGEARFFDVAEHCVQCLGLAPRMRVDCVPATSVQTKEKARRPEKAIMTNARLQAEGLDQQRPWRDSLTEYLTTDYFRDLIGSLAVV